MPWTSKQVVSEGKCFFFRPISFFVSGTEDKLDTIRAFLLQYMLENIDLAVGLFFINGMGIHVEQQCLQTWASKTLFTEHLLKTDIGVFSCITSDWLSELQISQLRLYIDHKNENHFKAVLLT